MTTTQTPTPRPTHARFTTPIYATCATDTLDREARARRRSRSARAWLRAVRDDPKALADYFDVPLALPYVFARKSTAHLDPAPHSPVLHGLPVVDEARAAVRKGERGLIVLAPILRKPSADEVASGGDPDRRVPVGFRTSSTSTTSRP